jgi:Tfp pilus assembly protein PilF
VESYQQALKRDPDRAEAHLNLAYAYQRLNRPSEAKTEYAQACRLESKFCQYVPADR